MSKGEIVLRISSSALPLRSTHTLVEGAENILLIVNISSAAAVEAKTNILEPLVASNKAPEIALTHGKYHSYTSSSSNVCVKQPCWCTIGSARP
jgi:hypothetical protein